MALPALGTMLLLSGLASGLDYMGARQRRRNFNRLRQREDARQQRIREQADAAYQQSLPRFEQEQYQQAEQAEEEEIAGKLKGSQTSQQLRPGLAPKATGETAAFEVAERGRERGYTDAIADARARMMAMGNVFQDYGLTDAEINRQLAEQARNARSSYGVFQGVEGPTAMSQRNLWDLGAMLTRAGTAAYGAGMFPGAPVAAGNTVIPNAPPQFATWAKGI